MNANTTSPCPSKFQLAAWDAAGTLSEQSTHVDRCPRCAAAVRELEDARRELLGDDPVHASQLAARRISVAAAERKAARFWRWQFLLPVGLAPVAATIALVVGTGGLGGARVSGDAVTNGAVVASAGNRAKGALVLEAFCKRGDKVFEVNEAAEFFAGDRLRFSYSKGEPGYLAVFGVDDTGAVFPYYQDAVLAGLSVEAGSRVMLPGSVELDAHKGWERVYAVWSRDPVSESVLRDAVRSALAGAGGDVRQAPKLPLSEGLEQVSYLLRRP